MLLMGLELRCAATPSHAETRPPTQRRALTPDTELAAAPPTGMRTDPSLVIERV